MYNFSCVTCLESLNDVSLPCDTGNGSQITCIEKINTSCVYYDGMAFPCAGILQGSKLNTVIANLCTDTSCESSSCTIMHTLTYSCEEGYVLTYDNPSYTAVWLYKHLATGDWETINSNLIESTLTLAPNNLLQRTDVIRDNSSFMNAEVKVYLLSEDCDNITLTLVVEEECELLERCDSSLAKFATHAGTNNKIYYIIQTAPPLTTTYLDWFRCYFFENTNTLSCGINDYETIYRIQRDAYLQDQSAIAITSQVGTTSTVPNPDPAPVAAPIDWLNGGPFSVDNPNFQYAKYPDFVGCGCNVGNIHFEIKYKPQVANLASLSTTTGTLGELVYVIDEQEFYAWDVNSLSWQVYDAILDVDGVQFYSPDNPTLLGSYEDTCLLRMRERRNNYKVALNEFLLAWQPFNVSGLIFPTSLLKRHIDENLPALNMTCSCYQP